MMDIKPVYDISKFGKRDCPACGRLILHFRRRPAHPRAPARDDDDEVLEQIRTHFEKETP